MVELSFMDNAVALEESTIFNIDIPLMSTPNFVVGGPTSQGTFYTTVQVTIQDDDSKLAIQDVCVCKGGNLRKTPDV